MSPTPDWRDADFLAPGDAVDLDNCEREPIHFARAVQPAGWMIVVDEDDLVVQWSADLDEIADAPDSPGRRTLHDLIGLTRSDLAQRARMAPVPMTFGNRICEVRTHRSRSGVDIVEIAEIDVTEHEQPAHVAVQQAIEALRTSRSLGELTSRATQVVRDLLGYDRVWIYRFDEENNGEVIAEHKRDDLPSFLGLHFDSGDIPAQARALFLENRVRVIRDASPTSTAIVPMQLPDGSELDLSDATLRAVSPMHLQYLANMGVRASASIAIVVGDQLWGLCSAHHYRAPRRLDDQSERTARLLSDVLSIQVEALERIDLNTERRALAAHAGEVLSAVARSESVLDGLLDRPEELLALGGADAAVVRVGGRVRMVGSLTDRSLAESLIELVNHHQEQRPVDVEGIPLVVTDRLEAFFDDSDIAAPRDPLPYAGMCALSLSDSTPNWVIWLRRPFVETVTWADPMSDAESTGILDPRASFAIFESTVQGRSRPWSSIQCEAITDLRSSLGVLVFQRTEQLSRSNAALRVANAELDRFAYVAAHDLKEPLRGLFNYTEILEEELSSSALDSEDVRYSLEALRRLTFKMSGLVGALLDYATVGRTDPMMRSHSLHSILDDAQELVRARAEERSASITFGPDAIIRGDRSQLTQLFSNLLSNAIKYTPADRTPEVDVALIPIAETERAWAGWPQHSVDLPPPNVIAVRDNGIGIAPDDRELVFEVFRRLHTAESHGDGSGAGLAIARRIAERHGGTMWVESNRPFGSIFLVGLAASDGS